MNNVLVNKNTDSFEYTVNKNELEESIKRKATGTEHLVFIDLVNNRSIVFDSTDEDQTNAILDYQNELKEQVKDLKNIKIHEIEIFGEVFNYEFLEDGILIKHPRWSLVGFGENLHKAELDLKDNMRLIADNYIYTPDSQQTADAIDFKQFLLNNLYY